MLRKSTAKYVLFSQLFNIFSLFSCCCCFCISNLIFLYLLCSTKHWTLFLHKKHFLGYISKYRPMQVATHILHIKKNTFTALSKVYPITQYLDQKLTLTCYHISKQQTSSFCSFFLEIFFKFTADVSQRQVYTVKGVTEFHEERKTLTEEDKVCHMR